MAPVLIFLGILALATLVGYFWLGRLAAGGLPRGPQRALEWIARVVLATVFLWAAYEKASDPYGFASSIYAYRVTPAGLSILAGLMMPAIEIAAAVALLTGFLWRGGAIILGGLLVVFIAALFQAILRGIDIDCGCFGQESSPVSFWLIARNFGLLLLALFPLVTDRRRARAAAASRSPTA